MPPHLSVNPDKQKTHFASRRPSRSLYWTALPAAALTVVIVVSVGVQTLKDSSRYTFGSSAVQGAAASLSAGLHTTADSIGDWLEEVLTPEIVYRRGD